MRTGPKDEDDPAGLRRFAERIAEMAEMEKHPRLARPLAEKDRQPEPGTVEQLPERGDGSAEQA